MTTLLLVRHAATDAAGKVLTGWRPGVHLNARGRAEADGLVERLDGIPIHAIYSSPLERCRETVLPLARARRLAVAARRALLEVDYGDWTGRSLAQLRRTKAWRSVILTPSAFRFPAGESFLEVQARAAGEVDRIARAHARGTVVVVTHADVVRLLLAHYAGLHTDHVQRLVVDPASVTAVQVLDGAVRLLKVNDTGGLDGLRPAGRRRARR